MAALDGPMVHIGALAKTPVTWSPEALAAFAEAYAKDLGGLGRGLAGFGVKRVLYWTFVGHNKISR